MFVHHGLCPVRTPGSILRWLPLWRLCVFRAVYVQVSLPCECASVPTWNENCIWKDFRKADLKYECIMVKHNTRLKQKGLKTIEIAAFFLEFLSSPPEVPDPKRLLPKTGRDTAASDSSLAAEP